MHRHYNWSPRSLGVENLPVVQYFPAVLAIGGLCFITAYGIQKRRAWVWYLGWLIALVFGAAICTVVLNGAEQIGTGVNPAGFALFAVGGATVWSSWAIWWYRHREEFGSKPGEPR